jgi:hypothetical protein
VWIQGGIFSRNSALYAGGNVAINNDLQVDPSTATVFCSDCKYFPSSAGYQTVEGFASGTYS